MQKNLPTLDPTDKGLFFLSLGGIGEIGANCYLYGCDGKWIMIDLGLSFADEQFPGIELLVPKIDFVDDLDKNLEAVIISHGHEDHAGALAFLANKIKCPVYVTTFAKLLIENRLKEFGFLDQINLIEININSKIKLKNFNLEFISTTHSIPQPSAIVISTVYGNLLHTADWKIDNTPTLGDDFNKKAFENLGNQGILALIGDSTNANIPGYSQSENEVKEELISVFSRYNKRIIITCFSSNIARMQNIVKAAKKNNRKIALVGRSMKKTIEAAVKSNFIKDQDIFISEEEATFIPKENLVIICTGSQGEKRSALYRIAYNSHRHIHLEQEDVVIFSSRDIPGNEKSINNIKNLLIRQKVEIITSEDELVHVSGHGYSEEIKKMYEWTRPYVSIPIHGEPKHLLAHSKLAQSSPAPITKILENGLCFRIAPDKPRICGSIKTGKMIVEGQKLYNSDIDFIEARRKISFEGLVLVSIIINSDYSLHKDIKISQNGLSSDNFMTIEVDFNEKFLNEYLPLSEERKSSDLIVSELIKKTIRQLVKTNSSKKPQVNSHILRL